MTGDERASCLHVALDFLAQGIKRWECSIAAQSLEDVDFDGESVEILLRRRQEVNLAASFRSLGRGAPPHVEKGVCAGLVDVHVREVDPVSRQENPGIQV